MPLNFFTTVLFFIFFIVFALASIIKVLREYERGVIFRLGRLIPVKGPGLIILIPVVDKLVKVDLRTVTMDVPSQDIITRDNISVKVNAVVYYRVVDPTRAITEVEDFHYATSQISQTTLTA
jgi:regulator of protease activity HflC (stomatin/prohibitin superfamily)